MAFFTYVITPIDFGWSQLPTVKEYCAKLIAEYDDTEQGLVEVQAVQKFVSKALETARGRGWEGDFRGNTEPRNFLVPSPPEFEIGLAWKQDNNGTTFVASRIELPWLNGVRLS